MLEHQGDLCTLYKKNCGLPVGLSSFLGLGNLIEYNCVLETHLPKYELNNNCV